MTSLKHALAASSAIALCAATAAADEGQWTPAQIAELDSNQLKALGLEIPATELWNDKSGLMRAAVNLSGCTGAFVSARGLIVTNHHCAYRAIQSQSTPERDYLKNGFLAHKLEQELQAKGYSIKVLRTIRDVTQQVLAAAAGTKDDRERYRALELARKKLMLECEKKDPALRCSVTGFYLGSRFELHESIELSDIRLVYAPPTAIGEYGGEIDNWMWPRHTGDFALLRAYVGPDKKRAEYSDKNQPYQPEAHLKIGAAGIEPGEFVAVLGYPARTNRYLPKTEVERQVDQVLPAVVELYGEWLKLLAAAKERSKAVAIKVIAFDKGLANRHKNARGMLDGIRRMRLLERRQSEERKLADWTKPAERKRYADALGDLGKLAEQRRQTFARDFLLDQIARLGLAAVAIDLVRRAHERQKPDLEREEAYMDRNARELYKTLERRMRDFDARVEAELIGTLAVRAKKLPTQLAIPALAAAGIEGKLRASRLSDAKYTQKLFDAEPEATLKAADPLLAWARGVVTQIEAARAEEDARSGLESRVGPLYFEMLKSVRGGPVYPDANGTLRFSYASVKGYDPSDGLTATPQTTLRGAIEKNTGTPPFALPQAVLDKAAVAKNSYWADAELNDVPLCFLSNADTTGGNSGSPVLNGKGELVGLNFDRVWENIAGDFGYSNDRSRNISVDIRYMLWLLDRVDNATALLAELGAAEFRSAPVQRARVGARRPSPGAPKEPAPPPPRSGCAQSPRGSPSPSALLGALALLLTLLRRRMCVSNPHG